MGARRFFRKAKTTAQHWLLLTYYYQLKIVELPVDT
jgi:hypothetical protein